MMNQVDENTKIFQDRILDVFERLITELKQLNALAAKIANVEIVKSEKLSVIQDNTPPDTREMLKPVSKTKSALEEVIQDTLATLPAKLELIKKIEDELDRKAAAEQTYGKMM
jgi:hypothetical protein